MCIMNVKQQLVWEVTDQRATQSRHEESEPYHLFSFLDSNAKLQSGVHMWVINYLKMQRCSYKNRRVFALGGREV